MVNSLLLLLLSTSPGLQDPTRPLQNAPIEVIAPIEQVPLAASLKLQAIFSGGRASAIIDGQRYHVGDTVQDYRLARIQPTQVLLEGQSEPLTLTLFPSLSTLSN
ncbi:MAG: MSHA biogenesis protein MshK [Oceanisphaera sp.]|uniref:SctD/MshK family protein n=1 Tax=Oceanisphaera sp. TaxID=1929979 RepID=UPI003C77E5A7